VIVGAIGYFAFRFMVQQPPDTVKATLSEIRDGKIDKAYDRFSDDYKQRFSREQFESVINAHPGLKGYKSIEFSETEILNDQAQLRGMVTSDSGSKAEVRVELHKKGTAWEITLLEVWDRASFLSTRDSRARA
jgi:hypothetical protein